MDYGGEAPTSEELGKEVFDLMDKYAKWLKESEHFVADETKRIKKNSWWSVFSGNSENPNPTNLGFVNEINGFKNLNID